MDLRRIAHFLRKLAAESESPEEKLYKLAKEKVEEKKEFISHLFVFFPTMLILTLISIFVTPSYWWWFLIPLVAWISALIVHYIEAFGTPEWWYFGKNWESRELEKEFLRLKYEKELEAFLKQKGSSKSKKDDLDLDELDLNELEKRYDEEDYV